MHERHGFVTFKGTPLTLVGPAPEIGSKAPAFTAIRGDLSQFSLADVPGKVVIVNSVPSLDTPVCAAQTRRFNQEAAGLGDGVRVLVISMDLPFAQKRFCTTEGIANLETLSDHRDASFGIAYGLLIKELRLLARAVLAIDPKGVLRYVQLVPEVGQEPDYDAALAAVRTLA
jgi:thioredoxin-dependent peroxiredoxin